MAGLLEPYIPNSSTWINSAQQGYTLGDATRNRDLQVNAGGLAAAGNLKGARSALYAGGDFSGAGQVDDRMIAAMQRGKTEDLAKAQRFNETMGNLALSADTPEKWEKAITTAQSLGMNVGKYRDFGARDLVMAQGKKTDEMLKNALEQRKLDILSDKATTPKPKTLADAAITKLGTQGGQLESANRYVNTFQDENAGYGMGGDLAMAWGRNSPIFNGPTTQNAASWWNDYDKYKNEVRHELFGSALTPNETAAFEKANVTPNMRPGLVRENLTRQREAVKSALRKHSNALKKSGYGAEAVDAAMGIEPDQLAPEAGGAMTNRIDLNKGTAQPGTRPRAVNPQTGEAVEFNEQTGKWEPAH